MRYEWHGGHIFFDNDSLRLNLCLFTVPLENKYSSGVIHDKRMLNVTGLLQKAHVVFTCFVPRLKLNRDQHRRFLCYVLTDVSFYSDAFSTLNEI